MKTKIVTEYGNKYKNMLQSQNISNKNKIVTVYGNKI